MSEGSTVFGHYHLLRRLGQGGMGEVFHAIDDADPARREVVIKRLLPHLLADADAVALFEREARVSARFTHPNIVRVLEFGEVRGQYYLALEYIHGADLHRVIGQQARIGACPPEFAAHVVRQACLALAFAHDLPSPVIHRDVSPSNVMVGFDGTVRLLDFGIAKALTESSDGQTRGSTLKGKFGYMAPERFLDAQVNASSDQFSLGVVLHELLTGRRLFRGSDDVATIAKVRSAPIAQPSSVNGLVSPALDAICLRALAREPAERFGSCAEMAAALDRIEHAASYTQREVAQHLEALYPGLDAELTRVDLKFDHESKPTVEVRPHAPAAIRRRGRGRLIAAGVGLAVVASIGAIGFRSTTPPPQPLPVIEPARPTPPTTVAVEPPVVPPAAPPVAAPVAAAVQEPTPPSNGESRKRKRPTPTKRASHPPAAARVHDPRRGEVFDPFAR